MRLKKENAVKVEEDIENGGNGDVLGEQEDADVIF